MERFERIFIICAVLVLDPIILVPSFLGGSLLLAGVVVIAVLAHVTAVQRFLRARAMLKSRKD